MDNIELLKRIVEESSVSHEKCAELLTMIRQMDFYIGFRAMRGDLYAQNVEVQAHDHKAVV